MSTSIVDASALNKEILARRIPHGSFKNACERGKFLLQLPDLGMTGSGFMLYGKSGVGKSALTKVVEDYGHKHHGPDSVMRTVLVTGATTKGMIMSLLYGFGDPIPTRSSAQDMVHRLKKTILTRGCRLIIIDELQHLLPGGTVREKDKDDILNAFKILDDTGVSFLLAGMEDITQLWRLDSQLRSRFQTGCILSHFIYPKDRPAWHGVIKKFLETMLKYGVTIDCPDIEDRFFAACKGIMRQLVLVLTTAISLASLEGRNVITPDDLRIATQIQIDELDGLQDAFDLDLQKIMQYNKQAYVVTELAPVERGLASTLSQ